MSARQSMLRRAWRVGAVGAAAAVLVALVGMVHAFAARYIVADVLSLTRVLLVLLPAVAALTAARGAVGAPAVELAAGALAGATTLAGPVVLVLVGSRVDLRQVFVNASPQLYEELSFGRGAAGLLLLVALGAAAGLAAVALRWLPPRWGRPLTRGLATLVFAGLFQALLQSLLLGVGVPSALVRLFFTANGMTVIGGLAALALGAAATAGLDAYGDRLKAALAALTPAHRRAVGAALAALGVLALLALPHVLGTFLSFVLVMVGLYTLMGWGLNLEVGWAGLLDLGFVAFYAIGAYTVAMLTSPEVGWVQLSFWEALPIAVLVSVLAGALLGIPVLGMRGDYVAIATLGFGEIVRLLFLSDWLRGYTGGSQGITLIAKPRVGSLELVGPEGFYYIVLASCALFLVVARRLRHSRLGRAWMAIREDEDVAEAMGIHLVGTKLLAYALGAGFGGVAGAIFASLIGSVYPHSFQVLVSINVLALIIVGGMGSLPGVFVGSLVLVGLPELLREFSEFRLLVYGALLIAMMQLRPEGFWPEAVIRRELRAAEPQPAPVPAAGTVASGGAS